MHACLLANAGWGAGDTTVKGVGHQGGTLALEKDLENSHPAWLSWSYTCQSLRDLSSFQILQHLNYPSIYNAHRQQRSGSIFFFSFPLFAFQLIEQMEILFLNYPVSPFDLSTSGRRLFGYICFLKMRVKTDMELGGDFLSLVFFPCLPHQYSFPRKTKK